MRIIYKTQYIHTLDGQPARFNGKQIVKAAPPIIARTVMSRRQIADEVNASITWRTMNGYIVPVLNYGYMKVQVATFKGLR